MADQDGEQGLIGSILSLNYSKEGDGWCYDYSHCHFNYVSFRLYLS